MSSISVVKIDWRKKVLKKHLAAANRFLKEDFPDADALTESGFQNLAHSHCFYLALRDNAVVVGIGVLVLYSTHRGRAGLAHIDVVEGASGTQARKALENAMVETGESTFREYVDFIAEPPKRGTAQKEGPTPKVTLKVTRNYY